MRRQVDLFLELGKVRISSLATISMITGYVLAYGGVSLVLAGMVVGVFLIACGSATINHIQERDIDGRMQRTKGRPLPSGRISVRYAWAVATLALTAGFMLILTVSNGTVMSLGLLAVFWYNLVYTPLKRMTAFAAVPGGLIGAIPPIMGWVAAGGAIFDPRILAVAFFFFMWQVPHFWLLLLFSCGRDYELAGLPSLTRLFTMDQIARVTFVWIFAAAVTCLVIPLFGIISNMWINVGLIAAGAWMVFRSLRILREPWRMISFRLAFKQINVFVCWIIALLSVNGILA